VWAGCSPTFELTDCNGQWSGEVDGAWREHAACERARTQRAAAHARTEPTTVCRGSRDTAR
jgi:sRNA-binding protein